MTVVKPRLSNDQCHLRCTSWTTAGTWPMPHAARNLPVTGQHGRGGRAHVGGRGAQGRAWHNLKQECSPLRHPCCKTHVLPSKNLYPADTWSAGLLFSDNDFSSVSSCLCLNGKRNFAPSYPPRCPPFSPGHQQGDSPALSLLQGSYHSLHRHASWFLTSYNQTPLYQPLTRHTPVWFLNIQELPLKPARSTCPGAVPAE